MPSQLVRRLLVAIVVIFVVLSLVLSGIPALAPQ
jgi:hypothetical protein